MLKTPLRIVSRDLSRAVSRPALSRRRLLETAVWAAPATVAVMPLLAACSKTGAAVDEMLTLGVRDAAAHIQSGSMKAEDYAARLLKQYAAHKDLNTVIFIDENRVLADARAVDAARARGDTLGPLAGVPVGVKDQADAAGYPTTAGNIALKGYVAKKSAWVVDQVVKNGAVVFAKMNCSAMIGQVPLNGATASNPYFGFVHNPYDLARMSGGSSGGPGAAVAARIVPAAIGEDTGGSVRIPSSCCGISGLRPSTFSTENFLNSTTRKRYSSEGMVPPAGPFDTFGPFARTVADVAFLDSIITGEATPTVDLKGVRIGVPRADYWDQDVIDPAVAKVTKDALAKLKDAGAELVEYDLNALLAMDAGGKLGAALRRPNPAVLADWLAQNAPDVKMEDLNRLRDSYPYRAPAPPELTDDERVQIVTAAAHQYEDAFKSAGLLAIAFPTLPMLPPLINVNGDTPGQKIMINGKWEDESTAIVFNLGLGPRMGAPGLNLPAGMSSGLPIGLSLQGLPGDDAKILGLGVAAEKVLGSLPPPPFLQAAA